MRKKWFLIVPAALAGALVLGVVGGQLVMHLWNWLMPAIFGWREVTFWQALGLLLLCRVLFGGVGRRLGYGRGRRHIEHRERTRHEMRERFGCRSSVPDPLPQATV